MKKFIIVLIIILSLGIPVSLAVSPKPALVKWTKSVSNQKSDLTSVATNGKVFVAAGEVNRKTGVILVSKDGAKWSNCDTKTSKLLEDNRLNSVTWGQGQFVAVGDKGLILTSKDGTSWTKRASGTTTDLLTAASSGKFFIAAGYSGVYLKSDNGTKWTAINNIKCEGDTGGYISMLNGLYSLSYGNGLWLGSKGDGEAGGAVYTSKDGVNWKQVYRNSAYSLFGSGVVNNVFFAYGSFNQSSKGVICYSKDGVNWTAKEMSGYSTNIQGITYFGGQFVATANGDSSIIGNEWSIYASKDGAVWKKTAAGTGTGTLDITADKSCLVAVGYKGLVLCGKP